MSSPRRRQLDRVVFTIHEHTASMSEALCRAASSQFIDPAFIKKVTEVKEDLEAAGGAVKMYREKYKEHRTAQLKQRATLHASEARRWFTYLDKILLMERTEF